MGVKKLWQAISPYGHKISLVELQGKQVAVDLGCWVCENQSVGERGNYRTKGKLHLRYFDRLQLEEHVAALQYWTTALLMYNVAPIFVLDGDAPDIKQAVVLQRSQLRYKQKTHDTDSQKSPKKWKVKRRVFQHNLRECEEMLHLLGLKCLWSYGEGEALCAQLDREGVVDGIITQDSDAFLYGAQKVYRNFTLNCGLGSVDMYEMSSLEKNVNLTREKLIAMSIFCGCDYGTSGIYGIGPEKAVKYLSNFKGDILERLNHLKTDKELEQYDAEKESCRKCKHSGKQHSKIGCDNCKTKSGCIQNNTTLRYYTLNEEEKMTIDFELAIRKKAMSNPNFPEKKTIREYLNFSQEIPRIKFSWREPNIYELIVFMTEKCNWCACYGFKKIIPLYCRWALLNLKFNEFVPLKILKKRIHKGMPSYDIQWAANEELTFSCKIHDNCLDCGTFTTTEPQVLIRENCEKLYEDFTAETSLKLLQHKKKGRKKGDVKSEMVDDNVDDLITGVSQMSVRDSKPKNAIGDCLKSEPKLERRFFDVEERENEELEIVSFSSKSCSEYSISENKENHFHTDLNDSCTVDYDISEYSIDESLILNDIVSRKEYY